MTPPDDRLGPWIVLRPSTIHGLGAFARTTIPRATRLLPYTGDIIDKPESLRRQQAGNPFIFWLNSEADLDGNTDTNPARHVNHSCSPNCDAELVEGKIWLVARRDIRSSEEITFNYGYDLENYRDYPCHCGSPACLGYIVAEEFHHDLRGRT
jgi:SET domain-containing protein